MLSIVLPTFNEAANLPELLRRIAEVMGNTAYQVIVVDDNSPDKTWEVAEKLVKQYPMLQVIRRIGRRGLSSAVVEGFDAAKGDMLMVMDSDLQHDPELIRQLSDVVSKDADLAVASRYMKGGSVGEWVRGRRFLSKTATWLTRKIPAVEVSDPMSGFFAIKRSAYATIRPMLHPTGFKILFEVLGHLPRGTKTKEIPLVFKMRMHGESKLSMRVQLEFLLQLVRIIVIRCQAFLFWFICAVVGAAIVLKLASLLPLYTNAETRSQVQQSMQSVATQNGWLISDVEILSIHDAYFFISYRPHRFGRDPQPICYQIEYADPALQEVPCSND